MDIFCTSCGNKIGDNFKFCPMCGTPVAKAENKIISNTYDPNEYMEYKKMINGEDLFFINVFAGNGESARKITVDHAKGNGAILCKNGMVAIDELIKEGYTFKNVEMPVLLGKNFNLYDPKCEVLEPDVIAKLYKVNKFLNILGMGFSWKKVLEILDTNYTCISQIDIVDILKKVMKHEIDMDLPVNEDKLRTGEELLLRMNYSEAMEWYKNHIDEDEDNKGYSYNIIGQIYIYMAQNSKNQSDQYYMEAVYWLEKSAELNNLLGNLELGYLYGFGYGVEKDISKALKYYLKAYEQGSKYALITFNNFMKWNFVAIHETGFRMGDDYNYEKLADEYENERKKFNNILLFLGYMYHHGIGRAISLEKAIYYYKKAVCINNEDGLYAKKMLDSIRREGHGLLIDNDNIEQFLKRAAYLAKNINDAKKEKKFIEEESFGELEPLKPEYTSSWILGLAAKDYEENKCYSQEELRLETQVYTQLKNFYDFYKSQWIKRNDMKKQEIEKKINDSKTELINLKPYLEYIGYSSSNEYHLEKLDQSSYYSEVSGVTIEEGLLELDIKQGGATPGSIKDRNLIIESLNKLSKTENRIMQLKNEDKKLKKCSFEKQKPVKPAYKPVLHEDAPSSVYSGRVCVTEQEYRTKLTQFYEEMKKYYMEKLQWLDLQPQKRVKINREKDMLQQEASNLYIKIDLPSKYHNQEAVDFIMNKYELSQSTLQEVCAEYDAYKERKTNLEKQEAERKRLIQEEQERIQVENARRTMDQWAREYEEQETARAIAYDERHGKKDLFGTTVCIKRFQTSIFDIKHSCTFCPQMRYCTRA